MLKLKQKNGEKAVWLVAPSVRIGSANKNDIIITGTTIEPFHCEIIVGEPDIFVAPIGDAAVYLNEVQLKAKQRLNIGDVLRIVSHEYVVIDPQEKQANNLAPKRAGVASSQAAAQQTVFRTPARPEPAEVVWWLQGLHSTVQNKRFAIEKAMVVGRSEECELSFSFERLSRKHAQLKVIDGQLVVQDLNSSNGTFRNGEKITQATLHHGDTLSFDKLDFAVVGPQATKKEAVEKSQTIMRPAANAAKTKTVAAAQAPANTAMANSSHKLGVIMVAAAVMVLAVLAFVLLM